MNIYNVSTFSILGNVKVSCNTLKFEIMNLYGNFYVGNGSFSKLNWLIADFFYIAIKLAIKTDVEV